MHYSHYESKGFTMQAAMELEYLATWRKRQILELRYPANERDRVHLDNCDAAIRLSFEELDKLGVSWRVQNECVYGAEKELKSQGYSLNWL
jgi:hypothetical protein